MRSLHKPTPFSFSTYSLTSFRTNRFQSDTSYVSILLYSLPPQVSLQASSILLLLFSLQTCPLFSPRPHSLRHTSPSLSISRRSISALRTRIERSLLSTRDHEAKMIHVHTQQHYIAFRPTPLNAPPSNLSPTLIRVVLPRIVPRLDMRRNSQRRRRRGRDKHRCINLQL